MMPLVTPPASAPELLALHAVRLGGMADDAAVAHRAGLPHEQASELLLDFEAYGWVRRVAFAGSDGWTLTDAGKAEGERRLSAELDETGTRALVEDTYEHFLPLNTRIQSALTDWQVRPAPGRPLAPNDHDDPRWDDRVLDELTLLGRTLATVIEPLAAALPRFDRYAGRYAAALSRAERGETRWIDGVGVDSLHRVWFELHEDLLATLGLERTA
jgi:hypothetical protein